MSTLAATSSRSSVGAWLAHPKVLVGGLLVLIFVCVAVFAPWLAPNDPNAQDLLATLLPPMWDEGGLGF